MGVEGETQNMSGHHEDVTLWASVLSRAEETNAYSLTYEETPSFPPPPALSSRHLAIKDGPTSRGFWFVLASQAGSWLS